MTKDERGGASLSEDDQKVQQRCIEKCRYIIVLSYYRVGR
jgi:hypothetical protein